MIESMNIDVKIFSESFNFYLHLVEQLTLSLVYELCLVREDSEMGTTVAPFDDLVFNVHI